MRKYIHTLGTAALALLLIFPVVLAGSVGQKGKANPTKPAPAVQTATQPEASPPAPPEKAARTGEYILRHVITGASGMASSVALSAGNTITFTMMEAATGGSASDSFSVNQGMWGGSGGGGGGGCCQVRGDVNHSSGVDVSDLTYLVDYLFGGGSPPVCDNAGYYAEADVNNSGGVDVSDLTYIVDYLFRGGSAPVPC